MEPAATVWLAYRYVLDTFVMADTNNAAGDIPG